jgi:hypothetical protein
MGKFQLTVATLVLAVAAAAVEAGPPVRIGIGIGLGFPYYYRPYYPYYYGYPYPYVVPAPVVYQSPPIVVQPGTVVGTTPAPSYSSPSFSAPEPTALGPANPNAQTNFEFHLSRLSNPDEALRRESVMELGRTRNDRAVDPLAATLAGDKSASVRDAAARALGLIGAPRSLTALIQAAQADNDRDVRHSAQFAVEIIRSHLQRN